MQGCAGVNKVCVCGGGGNKADVRSVPSAMEILLEHTEGQFTHPVAGLPVHAPPLTQLLQFRDLKAKCLQLKHMKNSRHMGRVKKYLPPIVSSGPV